MATPIEYFNRLNSPDKQKVLDNNREINVPDYWWEGGYEDFRKNMDDIGVYVDNIYFTGFWSQGDGACFEGCVSDWDLFLRSLGYTDAALITHAKEAFSFSVRHSGHHYHENSTHFEADLPLPEHDEDDYFITTFCPHESGSLHEAVWMAGINKYSTSSLWLEFTDAFKNHMRDLYRTLNDEYDYLTSDAAVLEALDANDMLMEAMDSLNEENENA